MADKVEEWPLPWARVLTNSRNETTLGGPGEPRACLSRLAPALSAQERAILVLEAWKDGRQEDPAWRLHMPQEQAKAFNYYIDLMNKANGVLGRLVSHLHVEAEKVELREGWLLSLTVWQDHVDEISQAVHAEVKAPAGRKRLEAVLDWTAALAEDEQYPHTGQLDQNGEGDPGLQADPPGRDGVRRGARP